MHGGSMDRVFIGDVGANGQAIVCPSGESLGVVFETVSEFDPPKQMQDLVSWVRESLEDKSYHPLIVIAVFNVVFLAIHPFQDGNGRLSRVLISLFIPRSDIDMRRMPQPFDSSDIPYSSLESIIEKNKDAYYLALQRTQKTLQDQIDWLPWLNFFLRSLKRQKDHLKTKTAAMVNYSHLPQESVLIMQYLDTHARITISDAYPNQAFRDKGLPTGSGTIESAIRRVINLRIVTTQHPLDFVLWQGARSAATQAGGQKTRGAE